MLPAGFGIFKDDPMLDPLDETPLVMDLVLPPGLIMFKSKFKVNWISIFLKLGSSLFPQPIFKHKGRTKFNIRDSPLLWTNKLWRLTLPWTSDNWSLCSRVNALPKTRTCKIISEKERLSIFLKKELISKARKMVSFKIEKHSNIGKKYLKNTIIYNILVLYRIVKMMFSSWARGEGASFLLTPNLN